MAKTSRRKTENLVEEAEQASEKLGEEVKDELEAEVEQVEKIEEQELVPPKKRFGKKLIVAVSLIVLVVVGIGGFYVYTQYQTSNNLLGGKSGSSASNSASSLVEEVGKLILLPQGETPKIATVTDITQLAGQPFFANAQNGDKVLIYSQAGKAILYRESINKIVEVSPLSPQVATQSALPNVSPTPEVKQQTATAVVLNGTLTAGLARSAQAKITGSLSNITVSSVGDAVNGGYQKTVVVDVSGTKSQAAGQVAKLLGASLEASIPDGENKPNADILIILGDDYSK